MTKEERANWVPQPGDEVVIREWDDMAEEFGYAGASDRIINCDFWFAGDMRKYCGNHYIVGYLRKIGRYTEVVFKDARDGIDEYTIGKDMLSPSRDEGDIFDKSNITGFLDSLPKYIERKEIRQ